MGIDNVSFVAPDASIDSDAVGDADCVRNGDIGFASGGDVRSSLLVVTGSPFGIPNVNRDVGGNGGDAGLASCGDDVVVTIVSLSSSISESDLLFFVGQFFLYPNVSQSQQLFDTENKASPTFCCNGSVLNALEHLFPKYDVAAVDGKKAETRITRMSFHCFYVPSSGSRSPAKISVWRLVNTK
jgi:hypothetical protein